MIFRNLTISAWFMVFAALFAAGLPAFAQAPAAGTGTPVASQALAQPADQDVPKTLTPGSEPIKLAEGNAYPATIENVVKIALKYKKLDINNDEVIDDIAKIEYCGVYNRDHLDEFTWRRVRAALRQKIESEVNRYPTLLYLNRSEIFGQYNFSESMLMLKPSSTLQNVNMLEILPPGQRQACGQPLDTITQDFIVMLDKQLNIDGVKMTEGEAKAVVSGLTKTTKVESSIAGSKPAAFVSDTNPENDVTRLGYGRYIVDINGPSDPPVGMKNASVFTGHISSVTFFEDPYYQKPFWRGLTSVREYVESQSLANEIQFKGIRDEPGGASSVTPVVPPH